MQCPVQYAEQTLGCKPHCNHDIHVWYSSHMKRPVQSAEQNAGCKAQCTYDMFDPRHTLKLACILQNLNSAAITPEKCHFSMQIQRQKTLRKYYACHTNHTKRESKNTMARMQANMTRFHSALQWNYGENVNTSWNTVPATILNTCEMRCAPNIVPATKNTFYRTRKATKTYENMANS